MIREIIEFGKIIRKKRQESGLSQEKLSLEAGIDRSFLSDIETGKKQPTLNTILVICRALDIRPSELFTAYEALIYHKCQPKTISRKSKDESNH